MTDMAEYRLPRSARAAALRAGVDARSGGVSLRRRRRWSPSTCGSRSTPWSATPSSWRSMQARLETPGRRQLGRPGRARRGGPAGHHRLRRRRSSPAPATGCTCASPASSTTSCTASTAAPSPPTTAPSTSSPSPSSSRPTPGGPFPCWDEPDFKATFAVTLVVDDDLTALSNASVASEEPAGDGRRRVRFNETMVMSTYLVAFVVGPVRAHARRWMSTASPCGWPPSRASRT